MKRIYPCYPHVLALGKQRSGKDLLLVADMINMVKYNKSIFEPYFFMEFLQTYDRWPKRVYSNCWLDSEVFGEVVPIESVEDITKAHDGLLYVHDAEDWFDSRGFKTTDKSLLKLVNDMGKRRLSGRFSAHRRKSIDVKLRTLFNLVVTPQLVYSDDFWDLENYQIMYRVGDGDNKLVGEGVCLDPVMYADAYDTREEVRSLK